MGYYFKSAKEQLSLTLLFLTFVMNPLCLVFFFSSFLTWLWSLILRKWVIIIINNGIKINFSILNFTVIKQHHDRSVWISKSRLKFLIFYKSFEKRGQILGYSIFLLKAGYLQQNQKVWLYSKYSSVFASLKIKNSMTSSLGG